MKSILKIVFGLFTLATVEIKAQDCAFDVELSSIGKDTAITCGYKFKGMKCKFNYPAKALEEGIQGNVYISFKWDPADKFNPPTVLRGLGYGLDEIAIRIVKQLEEILLEKGYSCPDKVQFNIPIKFKLN